ASSPIEFSLTELIQQTMPDRVLIEPTGLGHPAKVLDSLRGPWFRGVIDLRATVCLADSADYGDSRVTNADVFQDQLHMADVVVINKADRTSPQKLESFLTFVNGLFPPKSLIVTTSHGRFDLELLDTDLSPERVPLFLNAHPTNQKPETSSS